MNKMRRKEIMVAIKRLNGISTNLQGEGMENWFDELEDIISDIQLILDDETCYMDNIPENLQGGERYERAEEACESLEAAVDTLEYIASDDSIDDIVSEIDKATDYLSNAM